MLAYMNRESMQKNLLKPVTHGSGQEAVRSFGTRVQHQVIYKKVIDIYADCDDDTLLITVEQTGAACHTGNHSCFF